MLLIASCHIGGPQAKLWPKKKRKVHIMQFYNFLVTPVILIVINYPLFVLIY